MDQLRHSCNPVSSRFENPAMVGFVGIFIECLASLAVSVLQCREEHCKSVPTFPSTTWTSSTWPGEILKPWWKVI
jgi:hypothetical protein